MWVADDFFSSINSSGYSKNEVLDSVVKLYNVYMKINTPEDVSNNLSTHFTLFMQSASKSNGPVHFFEV